MITNRLKKLQDKTIIGMSVEGRLPELVIQLSNGFWVHSFATAEGQTEWAVFLADNSHCEWIESERSKLKLIRSYYYCVTKLLNKFIKRFLLDAISPLAARAALEASHDPHDQFLVQRRNRSRVVSLRTYRWVFRIVDFWELQVS